MDVARRVDVTVTASIAPAADSAFAFAFLPVAPFADGLLVATCGLPGVRFSTLSAAAANARPSHPAITVRAVKAPISAGEPKSTARAGSLRQTRGEDGGRAFLLTIGSFSGGGRRQNGDNNNMPAKGPEALGLSPPPVHMDGVTQGGFAPANAFLWRLKENSDCENCFSDLQKTVLNFP